MDSNDVLAVNGELYHWGIKGMKWGVRRYQNKDGSLTPAGKKRKAKLEAELKQLGGKKKDHSTATKSVSEMTNKELQKYTARMQLEKNYYDAQNQLNNAKPKQVSKGQKIVEKLLNDAVIPAVSNSARSYLDSYLSKTLGLNSKDAKNTLDKLKKEYEELDYRQKIDKIKNPDKYMTQDDLTKKYDRERKMKNDAESDARAAEKAKKESASANTSPQKDSNTPDSKGSSKSDNNSKTESRSEKQEPKAEKKVYEGTVEGVGNSSKKQAEPSRSTKKDTVIDAEWSEIVVSNVPAVVTNRGSTYISGLLEEPKGLTRR